MSKELLEIISGFLVGGSFSAFLGYLGVRYNAKHEYTSKKESVYADHFTELLKKIDDLLSEREELTSELLELKTKIAKQSNEIANQSKIINELTLQIERLRR